MARGRDSGREMGSDAFCLLNQRMSCLVMRKADNQTGSRSQRMSLGLSYCRGIMHMTDGWLQERKGDGWLQERKRI